MLALTQCKYQPAMHGKTPAKLRGFRLTLISIAFSGKAPFLDLALRLQRELKKKKKNPIFFLTHCTELHLKPTEEE